MEMFFVLFQLALLHLNFAEVLIERRDILARSRERDDTPNYQRSRKASRPYDAAQEQRDNDAGRNHDDGIAALVAQSIVLCDELRARGFQTRDFRLARRVGLARARRRAALFRRRAIAREVFVGVLQALELLGRAILQFLVIREAIGVQYLHALAIGRFDVGRRRIVVESKDIECFGAIHAIPFIDEAETYGREL